MNYLDFKIFLVVNNSTALERAKSRDKYIENVENRYLSKYFAGQKIYFDEVDPFTVADIIINNDDFNNPKIIKQA